jgi:uracil-DNA glycosylase
MSLAEVPRRAQVPQAPCNAQESVRLSALRARRQENRTAPELATAYNPMMSAGPLTAFDSSPETTLSRLRSSIQACRRCEALVRCRSRVVPGDGSVPAEVMFVGIAPGRLGGDRTGIPFSGDRSGNLLRKMIERSGLERVFITNLVRCNPRDEAGRNRDPTRDEIAHCREHFRAELALARPRIVACLGRMAWQELAGSSFAFLPQRGKAELVGNVLLFPMYHPAFVNRGAYPVGRYAKDFARLSRLCIHPGTMQYR